MNRQVGKSIDDPDAYPVFYRLRQLNAKSLATVKAGRCFGELLYFADQSQRRTTTVTSRSPITVMEVKADAMRAATDACQSAFNKACMRVLIERLVYSNQRLAQAA